MAEPRVKQTKTTPYDSRESSLPKPKISAKCQQGHPEPPNRGEVGSDWRFSTNILPYLRNGARQGHSYYGRLIGTRMCSISQLSLASLGGR